MPSRRASPPPTRLLLGGGPAAAGLVLASTAAATAVGTPLFARFVRPRRRAALMGPLAVPGLRRPGADRVRSGAGRSRW